MQTFARRYLLISAVALLSLGGTSLAEESVRIAYFAPLSGPFALTFEEGLKQFRAAVDFVNARGGVLGGKKLDIVPFDNKGTPQDTLLVLKQATDQDIRYVLATISSVAVALSDAVTKYNARNPDRPILYLDYDAREPSLTESKCSFWHFRFEPHADMQMEVYTDYIARQPSVHKLYLLNQDYAWGQSVARSVKELLARKRPDIEIVGNDLVALGKVKDFAPYVSKIAASGADSVMTGNWGADLILFIRAAQQGGLKVPMYTTHAWVVGTPSAVGAAAADRVKTIMTWHINAADSEWEKRLLIYEQKYKTVAHMDFLPGWQTIQMFAAAIEKAGSDDPLKVAFALEGMEYNGPAGPSWMRAEDHQLIAPTYIASIAKAGQPPVKHDNEGTGFGWKTELLVSAKDSIPPLKCQMERPAR